MAQHYTFYAKVDRTELNKALKQISFYDGKTRLKVEAAISSGAKRVASDARRKVARDTGALRKSIKSSFTKKNCTGYAKAMSPVAHLIENGVKMSVAKPKRKKVLRINARGMVRYTKQAVIPRRRPRPFLAPAYEANESRIIDDIKKAVRP